ncbi:MAG: right-handed parallel beta-helix repeat-containing protein [Pseudomonadota bacterium]|nr:MAG: right-handed parallel beta-helix repeat-containing protein [Pseudomonadota bacterium]
MTTATIRCVTRKALALAAALGLVMLGACSGGTSSGGSSPPPPGPGGDSAPPIIAITTPVSGAVYVTAASSVALAGTASDNVGVTSVTWSNDRGGSGNANGTTSWSVSSITLQNGVNVITVTARDAAGNSATATLTVTYSSLTPTLPTPTSSIFVAPSPAGSDTTGNGTISAPYATLAYAVSLVAPGQSIELRTGNYCGTNIGRPGTSSAWILLRAYNGENAVIQPCGRQNTIYFYRGDFAPMYWVMYGLEVQGGSAYTVKIDTPQVKLIQNNMYGSSADIVKLVATSDDVVIFGNEIHSPNAANGANAQGVDIVGADRSWVAYNYVHDIPSTGMYAKGNARNTIFEGNRVANIYARGIQLGQSTDINLMTDGTYEAYDGIMRNNIIVNTRDACLASASAYNIKIYNNSCYDAATSSQAAIYLANEAETNQAGTLIDIRNNIIFVSGTTSRPAIKINADAVTSYGTVTINNNIYWTLSGAPNVRFTWEGRGLTGASWDSWRLITGLDTASLVSDPLYTNLTLLTVASNGPAVNNGVTLPEVPLDYLGVTRPQGAAADIGAYEQ